MAYLILNEQGNLSNIAANDSDLNSLNVLIPPCTTIDISDEDFSKVKRGLVNIEVSGGNATFTDLTWDGYEMDQNEMERIHDNIKKKLNEFIPFNPSNAMLADCQNYLGTLESFDYSSVSFPLNTSWENYCEENSISYLHPLQIP